MKFILTKNPSCDIIVDVEGFEVQEKRTISLTSVMVADAECGFTADEITKVEIAPIIENDEGERITGRVTDKYCLNSVYC